MTCINVFCSCVATHRLTFGQNDCGVIVLYPNCRIPRMNSTPYVASVFLLIAVMQHVLGMRDIEIAKENSNTGGNCWQQVESILLNSSHHYTACMYCIQCTLDS